MTGTASIFARVELLRAFAPADERTLTALATDTVPQLPRAQGRKPDRKEACAVKPSFVAYIDESGDEGFVFKDYGSGSTRWFVLSAAVIRQVNDLQMVSCLKAVREVLRKEAKTPLHFVDLKHEQRVPSLAAKPQSNVARHSNVEYRRAAFSPDSTLESRATFAQQAVLPSAAGRVGEVTRELCAPLERNLRPPGTCGRPCLRAFPGDEAAVKRSSTFQCRVSAGRVLPGLDFGKSSYACSAGGPSFSSGANSSNHSICRSANVPIRSLAGFLAM